MADIFLEHKNPAALCPRGLPSLFKRFFFSVFHTTDTLSIVLVILIRIRIGINVVYIEIPATHLAIFFIIIVAPVAAYPTT